MNGENMVGKGIAGEHFLVAMGRIFFLVGLYSIFIQCGPIVFGKDF
ncbi:MAG: hypothetical protein SPD11_14115 [Sphaerochaetaceae bacterium]|nr:hypothetical protein [Sphaerochaetaceae bacterium]